MLPQQTKEDASVLLYSLGRCDVLVCRAASLHVRAVTATIRLSVNDEVDLAPQLGGSSSYPAGTFSSYATTTWRTCGCGVCYAATKERTRRGRKLDLWRSKGSSSSSNSPCPVAGAATSAA